MPRQGDPEPHLFEIFEITKILHLISRSIDFRLPYKEPGTRVVADRSILDKEGSVSLQKAKLYKKDKTGSYWMWGRMSRGWGGQDWRWPRCQNRNQPPRTTGNQNLRRASCNIFVEKIFFRGPAGCFCDIWSLVQFKWFLIPLSTYTANCFQLLLCPNIMPHRIPSIILKVLLQRAKIQLDWDSRAWGSSPLFKRNWLSLQQEAIGCHSYV